MPGLDCDQAAESFTKHKTDQIRNKRPAVWI
jgi:hypothetical protein